MLSLLFWITILAVMREANAKPSPIHKLTGPNALSSINSTSSVAHLAYYGGPVLANVKVFTLFLGSGVNYASQLNSFYTGIVSSTYVDWLQEYSTSTQTLARGSFGGTYSDPGWASGTYDDSTLQTKLKNYISVGSIPAPDGNTLYAMHFAPGITITLVGTQSCVVFCAYHGTIQYGNQYIFYTVVPDQGGQCAGGCGSNPSTLNNLCSVSSHEFIESITDAGVGLASTYAPPLGWYDVPDNEEIGDICNAQQTSVQTSTGQWTVQLGWSNSQAKCYAGPGVNWDVYLNNNNVYGKIASPGASNSWANFLGNTSTAAACENLATVKYYQSGPYYSWTWHDGNNGGWDWGCYGVLVNQWLNQAQADHYSGQLQRTGFNWINYPNYNNVYGHVNPGQSNSWAYYLGTPSSAVGCEALASAQYYQHGPFYSWTWHDGNNGGYNYMCWGVLVNTWLNQPEADHFSGLLQAPGASIPSSLLEKSLLRSNHHEKLRKKSDI